MEPVLCGTLVSQQGSSHHHQLEIPTLPSQTIPISKTNRAQARHATAEALQAGSGQSLHLQGHLGNLVPVSLRLQQGQAALMSRQEQLGCPSTHGQAFRARCSSPCHSRAPERHKAQGRGSAAAPEQQQQEV